VDTCGQGRLRDLYHHGQQGLWYTLNNGELTEVYYPDLITPSVRDLQFVVSDGATFAERETDATTRSVQLVDGRALEYRQIDTDKDGKYRITKTYVTDPARLTVLVDVTFESLDSKPYQLYALYDLSLNNGGDDDTAGSQNGQLLASDGKVASALVAAPRFDQTSSGYKGKSDGWVDLQGNYKMDWTFGSASKHRSDFFALIFPSCSVGSSVSYSAFGKKSLLAAA
jgi:glucoamylase